MKNQVTPSIEKNFRSAKIFGGASLSAAFLSVAFFAAWAVQPSGSAHAAKVTLGVDMLKKDGFAALKGKRVGLITNQTGVDGSGKSTIDILNEAKGVELVALFCPEHGIRGKAEHGVKIADERDAKTGLPVYSLYGKNKRPTDEMLKGLDVVVFDIQDIGTRFYTYTTTLAYALEECAKRNIEFVVLDRPNPITGAIVEGEPLSESINHFTAYLKVPVRHGMTAGEIANWHNKKAALGGKVTVIKMDGWKRWMWMDDTGIKFRATSPNIRTLNAATLYPGIGCFETTNVAVGRGTKTPFELIGAPWIDGEELANRLEFYSPNGVEIKAVKFTPKKDLYKDQLCGGVKFEIEKEERNALRPFDLFIYLFLTLADLYPEHFEVRWDELARVTGSEDFRKSAQLHHSAEAMFAVIHAQAQQFQESVKSYLLYE